MKQPHALNVLLRITRRVIPAFCHRLKLVIYASWTSINVKNAIKLVQRSAKSDHASLEFAAKILAVLMCV